MKKAQADAATARAGWLLRNDITDSVMTANPILKTVHGSTQATPIETLVYPPLLIIDSGAAFFFFIFMFQH